MYTLFVCLGSPTQAAATRTDRNRVKIENVNGQPSRPAGKGAANRQACLQRLNLGHVLSAWALGLLLGAARLAAQGYPVLLQDYFPRDSSLNVEQWSAYTPLLQSLVQRSSSPPSRWVMPVLSFSPSGMSMSGVNGHYEFAGVQSKQAFAPPFSLSATVMGTASHGNAFVVYLVNQNLSEWLELHGDLDPTTCYRGVWLNHSGSGEPMTNLGANLYAAPVNSLFYNIRVNVGADGGAAVAFRDAKGATLAFKDGIGIGRGPFHVVLAQREGLPCVGGANSAVWNDVTVFYGTGPSIGQPDHISTPPTAEAPAAADSGPLDCVGLNDPAIVNNTHGRIRIRGGTGAFQQFSQESKSITVPAGSHLDGTLSLLVRNAGPGFAVAPMIGTPSWGDAGTSFWNIAGWVRGEQTVTTQVHLVAPIQPNTYHILFAMQLELSGADVASGTSWALHHDAWGDGNDISQFSADQIGQAQKYGCTTGLWLGENGLQKMLIPADALTVRVTPPLGLATPRPMHHW